jgi:predicted metal-dependent peptidase
MVEADSEIKNAYTYKRKKQHTLSGRGGTSYQPAFDYFNKIKDIDGVIYFGDMDSSDEPIKPKYSVLWAIVGNQKPPANFGSKIYIKEER